MDASLLLALTAAGFGAGFTQGLAGFGSTLVALPCLILVMDLRQATPVACILAIVLNAVLACRLRGHVRTRALGLLLAASLPGMAVGAYGLRSLPEAWLKGLLAMTILGYVAWFLRRSGPARRADWKFGVAAGFLAGSLGAAIGVNGPPVVAWVSRLGIDRNAVRGTQTAYFFLAGIGVVASQAAAGLVTGQVLARTAVAVPALLVGLAAGMAGCGRISEAAFGRVVLVVLVLTAASLLAQVAAG
ncbi:protein of unknown function DUF81 [Solidesulfovibrio carbinoliphilus subsp. oakridgensis]|uniref:Probable membrane transporter protein n=1 Tax=Solidesulfovibrio carbinoliphilus subsp. oakridgensis TaxID=694327 RepID=G7Q934_9BACT|nr:sulfite exporter TauE/SafE family protein [Solidesulfovibrio carbinoliphilus]EHJ47756.1 protein of unknown function DUF81 [Solidesulfovibrio carbinoliphilus subsp. oakridgensis]